MAGLPHRRGFLPFTRGRGIPLFTVLGIRVVADYSWFIVVALIIWVLAFGWFPLNLPGRSTLQYVLLGAITSFFFFASVFVHELSHSVVASLNGIPVRRITLFLFGGVAEILKEPPDARTELKIALAGPAMSALIAAACWTAWALLGARGDRPGLQYAFLYLALANTILLAFNLLPGLPLDGGRVLRALLWKFTRNVRRATRVASTVGKVLAGLIAAAGVATILWGGNWKSGLWLLFIALFLRQAAETSYRQLLAREALAGIRVSNVMTANAVVVPPDISLADLIETYLLRYHFTTYPVMADGRPVGLITIKAVKRVPREAWGTTSVTDVMMPIGPDTSLAPDEGISSTLEKMASTGLTRMPVVDSNGSLVGIVSRRDVMNYLQIRSDLSAAGARDGGAA